MKYAKFSFIGHAHQKMVLATGVLFLSGCQLLSAFSEGGGDAKSLPQTQYESYAQTVIRLNNHIDSYLSQSGRENFLKQISTALESDSRSTWKGKDRNTNARWRIEIQQKKQLSATVNIPTLDKVDKQPQLVFVDVPYRSKADLSIYAAPTREAETLSALQEGETFNVIAQVAKQSWFLIEQQGVVKGYVEKDYTLSNIEQRDILATLPSPFISPHLIKNQVETSQLFEHHQWSADYTCRYLTYHLNNDSSYSHGTMKACRKQRKVWFINPPKKPNKNINA